MTPSIDLSQAERLLSSAKLQMSHFCTNSKRSFIKILKKSGPNIEP